jgi:hypothetical protein
MSDLRPIGPNGPIDKPLVDDLADVLAGTVVGWEKIIGADLAQAPEVVRVMARYRAESPVRE